MLCSCSIRIESNFNKSSIVFKAEQKTLIYVWGNNETFGSDKQECFLWIVNHKCVYWLKIFALLWNLLLCGTCMRHAWPASGTTSFYMPCLPTFTLPMLKGQHLWWSPFAIYAPHQVCDCPNDKRQKAGGACAKVHNAHCAKVYSAHCAKAHTAHNAHCTLRKGAQLHNAHCAKAQSRLPIIAPELRNLPQCEGQVHLSTFELRWSARRGLQPFALFTIALRMLSFSRNEWGEDLLSCETSQQFGVCMACQEKVVWS